MISCDKGLIPDIGRFNFVIGISFSLFRHAYWVINAAKVMQFQMVHLISYVGSRGLLRYVRSGI